MDWHIVLGMFGCLLAIALLIQVEDALWGVLMAGIALLATMLIDAVRWLVRNRA